MLGVFAPCIFLAQNKNSISLQTGLLHCFFDQTQLVNSEPTNQSNRIQKRAILSNILRGKLIDSRGIKYERQFNSKSAISAEYMFFDASYNFEVIFNNPSVKPVISGRNTRLINVNYTRKKNLTNKFELTYSGGINYLRGREDLYHYTFLYGFGEHRFYSFYRHDFGLNGRIGFEYSPYKWLTLYSNIDFIGLIYLNTKDNDGNKVNKYYYEKFGLKNIPSRYDLSWRFGFGFNF